MAAAARDHTHLLIFGLLLSVFLIGTVATFFAEYIKKHSDGTHLSDSEKAAEWEEMQPEKKTKKKK